jgi:hypothetical protein
MISPNGWRKKDKLQETLNELVRSVTQMLELSPFSLWEKGRGRGLS